MSKITSCPVCRGEIHAIAGRCKHCKADLVELRERSYRLARAQAIGATVPPAPRFGMFAQGARPMTADGAPTVREPAPHPLAPPPESPFHQQPRETEPLPIHDTIADTMADRPLTGEVPVPEPTTAEMEAAYDPTQFQPPPGPFPPAVRAPVRPFPGRVPGPPPGGTPPYGIGFAPVRPRRASSWSRRWPLLVSAVALLAIGISIGVLAERWRHNRAPADRNERHSSVSRTPIQVPDHMPQPLIPGPAQRRTPDAPADPTTPPSVDPHAVVPDPATPSDPDDPRDADPPGDPSNPGSRFSRPPAGQGGDATGFRTFSAALTDSLCQKLTQCGVLDGASQSMCQMLGQELNPNDAADKVARGECSFDQRAADACLRAVADLPCDGGASDRMMAWLMAPNRVGQCAEAYVCQ